MKIAVIAADGRSGKMFVEAALPRGHAIHAGVMNDSKSSTEQLIFFECNATNKDHVSKLISGCDAVVSFMGHVKNSPPTVQTDAMIVITSCMQEAKIKRLISLTGTGVARPEDITSFIDRILNISISIIDPDRVKDGINHAKIIEKSGLDWTVIRVDKLTNTKPGNFRLTAHGPAKKLVSRKEVALAVLDILENDLYIGQFPMISPALH